jgi:peptidoglycan/LPS O-acetylase OafA/YrhL
MTAVGTEHQREAPEGSVGAPSGRFAHLKALDGLRGFAVLLVVLSHFLPNDAPGGFLGVDLFFVLSGFLITSLLVAEWGATGRIALGNFWVRRARRLLPALLVVLAAVGLVGVFTASRSEMHQLGLDGLASLFYVANWRFIAAGQSYVMEFVVTAVSPLRHMWSLAIEEQFYLLWPLVALAAGSLAGRPLVRRWSWLTQRHLLAGISAVLAVASALWMVVAERVGVDLDRIYYGTDTRVFMILGGAILGALTAGTPTLAPRLRPVVIAGGLATIIGLVVATAVVTTADVRLYQGGYIVVAVALVVLLVAAAQPGRNPVARVLSTQPLVGLGLISYGVYLWHWPVSVWLTSENTGVDGVVLFALRSAVTMAASLASYHFVEQPIRRNGLTLAGKSRVWLAPAAVAGVAVALLVPVMAFPSIAEAPDDADEGVNAQEVTARYAASVRCDGPGEAVPVAPDGQVRVQLVGNSLASEVRPCLGELLEQRGVELVSVSKPGFLLCTAADEITAQASDPAAIPEVAILFAFVAYDDRCGTPWHRTVDELVAMWVSNGTHVILVPTVETPAGGREEFNPGAQLEVEHYQTLAAADPTNISVVDAGVFLRDTVGTYLWRMPCVDSSEPGCDDDGKVGVRFVDGIHFCTDSEFATRGCPDATEAAGERRAAAAIAGTLIELLTADSTAEQDNAGPS